MPHIRPTGLPEAPLPEAPVPKALRSPDYGKGPEPRKGPHPAGTGLVTNSPGGVLLSQGVAPQVPSALVGLTSVFGMGTGVAPPLWPPGTFARSKAPPGCAP